MTNHIKLTDTPPPLIESPSSENKRHQFEMLAIRCASILADINFEKLRAGHVDLKNFRITILSNLRKISSPRASDAAAKLLIERHTAPGLPYLIAHAAKELNGLSDFDIEPLWQARLLHHVASGSIGFYPEEPPAETYEALIEKLPGEIKEYGKALYQLYIKAASEGKFARLRSLLHPQPVGETLLSQNLYPHEIPQNLKDFFLVDSDDPGQLLDAGLHSPQQDPHFHLIWLELILSGQARVLLVLNKEHKILARDLLIYASDEKTYHHRLDDLSPIFFTLLNTFALRRHPNLIDDPTSSTPDAIPPEDQLILYWLASNPELL